MAFAANIDQHTVIMDTTADSNGDDSGPSPKKLMLATLAGCTGMDVVSLLQKMHVAYSDFSIDTIAELTETHPKVFSKVDIIYRIKIDEQDRDKMEKAVTLSREKYCGVSAMLSKNNPIAHRIEYL